ncbi:hypothetical protein [uncultured Methylobacterium sp.]|jgi:DNA-binding NarL/FixJ family response regulator|uniref:hypothetical protein n=1 Tax=uncultured Methylobacterium sp. TaxID=157278 RepID=UPI0026186E05|nr:hypothetical protein [uncultured Methylobacterium sp.]
MAQKVVLGLRARGLSVHVDSVVVPEDQTEASAFAMVMRLHMNPDLVLVGIEMPDDYGRHAIEDTVERYSQERLQALYRTEVRP